MDKDSKSITGICLDEYCISFVCCVFFFETSISFLRKRW